MKNKNKIYRVNILSSKPIFTNSMKVKRQLEKNAKKVIQEMSFKVYWDKEKASHTEQ